MLSINNPSESIDGSSTNKTTTDLENASSSPRQDAQGHKKKKKKRSHESDQAVEIDSAQGRKKKRKHRDNDQESATQELQPVVPNFLGHDMPPKRKKRKKGKEKDPASPTDAEIEASSHASAAALLSAIVAASVSNSEPLMSMHYDSQTAPQPPQLHQPFAPYPYPFIGSPAFHCDSTQAPSVFPSAANLPGIAFSQLAFGSNEDVLRALQELDITKITSVLKTLGDAASNANAAKFAPQVNAMPSELQPPPPAVWQVPATSNVILGIPPKPSTSGSKNLLSMSLPGNEQHTNPDHAYLLANKWLNATKLAELVRDEGLVYKKGKFSAIEEQQLKSAIERYQNDRQLDENQLLEVIFAKNEKNRDTAFWSELTAAVPLRPIVAVYHHVRRSHHPLKLQGQWKEHEDDLLTQAVTDLGQQWEKVSFRVGRMASDCRDRYRNHIINRDIRVSGHWSKEEEDKLTAIVTDMTVNQGKDIDNDVFWGKVSELMGGKRGRQQCRIKWTDALSKTVKNEGQKPRWSAQDGFILVHKIDSLNVRDDTEIDWKTISDADWNLWSAHTLQRRWFTLKRSVKGHENMTHQEIMDILRIKKAHLPSPPAANPRKRREKKVVGLAAIPDIDSSTAGVTVPEAGSSTGVGTLNHANVGETERGNDEVAGSEGD